MSSFDLRLLLDILILGFLVGTIIHATMLNRNLNRLRDSRAELDGLVQNLSASVTRAEAAIQGMKRSAAECGSDLQKQINAARSLADELHIMNESGNNLAQRLERSSRANRSSIAEEGADRGVGPSALRAIRPERTVLGGASQSAVPSRPSAGEAAGKQKMTSRAERELFAAIETARKGTA